MALLVSIADLMLTPATPKAIVRMRKRRKINCSEFFSNAPSFASFFTNLMCCKYLLVRVFDPYNPILALKDLFSNSNEIVILSSGPIKALL